MSRVHFLKEGNRISSQISLLRSFEGPTDHKSAALFQASTHWGRMTHISVDKLTIIGSDNGLSPGWRQAIIWTRAGILLIGPLETNFSEILIWVQTFSFKKMLLKMSSAKWRPFCPGFNVLNQAHLCHYIASSGHGMLTSVGKFHVVEMNEICLKDRRLNFSFVSDQLER